MILLDTHVLIWYVSDSRQISKKALKLINSEREKKEVSVSSISVWEIYMLNRAGRLEFKMEIDKWINYVEHLEFIHFEPINNNIASQSVKLPGEFHKDPADRIIIATARELDIPLITRDLRIQEYPHVTTVW